MNWGYYALGRLVLLGALVWALWGAPAESQLTIGVAVAVIFVCDLLDAVLHRYSNRGD